MTLLSGSSAARNLKMLGGPKVPDEDDDELVQLKKSDLQALREAAREAQKIQPQFEQLQREVAFSKAGIDLSDKQLSYFVKGYQGDLTADAIRAEAQAAGFLKGTPQPPASELQAHTQMQEASAGTEGSTDSFQDAMARANSVEEVMLAANKLGYPTTWNRRDA